jgi:hypothetical protein
VSLVTVNGTPCVRATIRIPRIGVWFADLAVDVAKTISGPVTISVCDGALELRARAARRLFKDTAVFACSRRRRAGLEVAKLHRLPRCPRRCRCRTPAAAAEKLRPSRPNLSTSTRRVDTLLRQKAGEALGPRRRSSGCLARAARRHRCSPEAACVPCRTWTCSRRTRGRTPRSSAPTRRRCCRAHVPRRRVSCRAPGQPRRADAVWFEAPTARARATALTARSARMRHLNRPPRLLPLYPGEAREPETTTAPLTQARHSAAWLSKAPFDTASRG